MGIEHLPLFLITSIAISLIPGPSTMYILGRSLSQGKSAGVMSVLGISTGSLCHTIAVAFGLSALLLASQTAFWVIKVIGGCYLIYLGVHMLLSKNGKLEADLDSKKTPANPKTIYFQGLSTQILNPKAAIFFTALLPQFVNPSAGQRPLPFLELGAIFVVMDTMWFMTIAVFSAGMSEILRKSKRAQLYLKRATGLLYVGLGLSMWRAKYQVVH